jgi:hypothetical protein
VKVDKRFSRRYQLTASYALARQYELNGINNLDNRFESWGSQGGLHGLNVSGIADLPWRFHVSFINAMGSRGPCRPSVSGVDLHGDGVDTASLARGTAPDREPAREKLEAAVSALNTAYPGLPNGRRPRTSRNQVIPKLALPATYSFGENFFSQDLRVTKSFVFRERCKLSVSGEGFNIFNIANLGGISSTVNSAGFGAPTSRAGQVFGSGRLRRAHQPRRSGVRLRPASARPPAAQVRCSAPACFGALFNWARASRFDPPPGRGHPRLSVYWLHDPALGRGPDGDSVRSLFLRRTPRG